VEPGKTENKPMSSKPSLTIDGLAERLRELGYTVVATQTTSLHYAGSQVTGKSYYIDSGEMICTPTGYVCLPDETGTQVATGEFITTEEGMQYIVNEIQKRWPRP
jgi:hypothetical protein